MIRPPPRSGSGRRVRADHHRLERRAAANDDYLAPNALVAPLTRGHGIGRSDFDFLVRELLQVIVDCANPIVALH